MSSVVDKLPKSVPAKSSSSVVDKLPKSMPAVMAHGPHDYRFEERPVPKPGPGEVLLKVKSTGVCASDIKCYTGAAVLLAVAVVLSTGCSSTGTGFNPLLISPLPAAQQSSDVEENGLNQPARSPAFNDFFGS